MYQMQTVRYSVFMAMLFLFVFDMGSAGDLYFIADKDAICRPAGRPCPTAVYKFTLSRDSLCLIQNLDDESDPLLGVDVFQSESIVLMRRGPGYTTRVLRLTSAEPEFRALYSAGTGLHVKAYELMKDPDQNTLIRLTIGQPGDKVGESVIMRADGQAVASQISPLESPAIAGVGGQDGGARLDDRGNWAYVMPSVQPPCPCPPDSLITVRTSRGWTQMVRSDDLAVYASVPDSQSFTKRELLICNTRTGRWRSTMVDGARTTFGLFGDWLAGTVAQTDPRTDFGRALGYEPVRGETAAFINLRTLSGFIDSLGSDNEVLTIAADTLIYRVGGELYEARLSNTGVVDRHLLLRDPRIRFVHWAFRGRE